MRVCKIDKRQFFGASIVKATAWIQKNVKFCRIFVEGKMTLEELIEAYLDVATYFEHM